MLFFFFYQYQYPEIIIGTWIYCLYKKQSSANIAPILNYEDYMFDLQCSVEILQFNKINSTITIIWLINLPIVTTDGSVNFFCILL